MVQTTKEELDYIVSQLKPVIMEHLRQYGVGVGEIELAISLEGVNSLPALMREGGVDKVVEVPLKLLSDGVDDVKNECIQATQNAINAADTANQAAENVAAQLEDLDEHLEGLEELKATVEKATVNADESAQQALDAAAAANGVIDAANAATERANTAASSVENTNATVIAAETVRVEAESKRVEAESKRVAAELLRESAETERKSAESQRATSESQRTVAETARSEAESQRAAAESTRNQNEDGRTSAESDRVTAEQNRTVVFEDTITKANLSVESCRNAAAVTEEMNEHPMIVQGGYWFVWDLVKHEYVNTNIQAKGDVGSSFNIIGRYDSLEALKEAVPDGTDIDGVFAVGIEEPFDYYAWLVIDGVWQWDNQGKLRGAEGKSAFEVWKEIPGNADKTEDDYFRFLSVKVEVVTDTPEEYVLQLTSGANGTVIKTPNLKGRSGSRVIDIEHEPTSEDTSYVYNGVTYDFNVGDEVRYYNAEDEEYVFYRLYDVGAAGAAWGEAGSGTALPFNVYLQGATGIDQSTQVIINGTLNNE